MRMDFWRVEPVIAVFPCGHLFDMTVFKYNRNALAHDTVACAPLQTDDRYGALLSRITSPLLASPPENEATSIVDVHTKDWKILWKLANGKQHESLEFIALDVAILIFATVSVKLA